MADAGREIGEILSITPAGRYTQFTVVAPSIAAGFKPGHFVAVAVGASPDDAGSSMLLRRSFALLGATPTSDFAGTISFVVADAGPGTHWLVQRRVGEYLDLLGPLGVSFPMPSEPVPAVLVGGGYGTAPLLPLATQLREQGSEVAVIVGASTADALYGELAVKRALGTAIVTTDDGTAGERGRVTDVLPETIERLGAQVVYACGPMPMLRAVGAVAQRFAIPAQVAVEEAMACGIGVCMTCVLPVRGDDGRSRFVRACTEGPVFDAARVRFDDVGRLPGDLVGADAMTARRPVH